MLELDHLVWAVPDVGAAVDELEQRLGVRAAPGGSHPLWGTKNALLALGASSYLEIIGPDPSFPTPERPRPFGIDDLTKPRLATWAVKAPDIDTVAARVKEAGYDPGRVHDGSRKTPDGAMLAWKLTRPKGETAGGLVPFLIDWGASPHPAASAPGGCAVTKLSAEHVDPDSVARILSAIGVELPLAARDRPRLIAEIDSPAGAVTLS